MINRPRFKKGDRCVFVYPIGKQKVLSVLDNNMIIDDEPFWNNIRNEWSYPIKDKSNPSEESFLILYNKQEVGDII